MKIAFVFAVRHGSYAGKELTPIGVAQSEGTASAILNIINGERRTIHLFHSPLPRAAETASILCRKLGVENPKEMEELAADEFSDGVLLSEEIEKRLPETEEPIILIIVSHFELPSGVIAGFTSRHHGETFRKQAAPYGGGYQLDFKTGVAGPILQD